jgi:hypothetical protein
VVDRHATVPGGVRVRCMGIIIFAHHHTEELVS